MNLLINPLKKMKLFKKHFLLIFLIGFLSVGFVACDDSSDPDPNNTGNTNNPDGGNNNGGDGNGGDGNGGDGNGGDGNGGDGNGGDGNGGGNGGDGGDGGNDKVPALSVTAAEATEGSTLRFEFSLDFASKDDVVINTATASYGAQNGLDFVGFASKKLTISAGQTTGHIDVETIDDDEPESKEWFWLDIEQVEGATVKNNRARGTIIDND